MGPAGGLTKPDRATKGMQPEKELRADHEAIRRAMRVLEGLTAALWEGHGIPDTDLRRLVDWTQELATRHHEGPKQATLDVLRGLPDAPEPGTVRELDEQHDEVMDMFAGVRELVDPATQGDTRARDRLATRAERFGEAMRELLKREEEAYLNDLDSSLPREQLDELADRFEELAWGPEERETIERNVDRLADRYEQYLGS